MRCAPLAETVNRKLDFSRDTPHDSTHPDIRFDHSSAKDAAGPFRHWEREMARLLDAGDDAALI